MSTEGIEAVVLESGNWGKAAKFSQAPGFEPEFSAGRNPGLLPDSDGPYLFIAEVPEGQQARARIVVKVPDADASQPDPALEVITPFPDTRYGTREMTIRDLDGRLWSLPAPAANRPPGERHHGR